jgi:hypothetical protein
LSSHNRIQGKAVEKERKEGQFSCRNVIHATTTKVCNACSIKQHNYKNQKKMKRSISMISWESSQVFPSLSLFKKSGILTTRDKLF